MISVNLVDEAGVLSPADFARLQKFIVDRCLCMTEALDHLDRVKVRNDGNSGYSGYWTAKYNRVGANIKDLMAVIILNSFYLKTVQQMETTLAHEFGHHWTLGYLMEKFELNGWFGEPAPWLYYRIRGLDPAKYVKDYSKGWSFCDKEVMAEDYKYLFSPYSGAHRMHTDVGNPITEVSDYIRWLGEPSWI